MNGQTYRALLAERQGRFTEPEVRTLLSQVLPQLMHLHQQGMAHGGISPDTLVQDPTTQQSYLIAAQPLTDSSYIAPECLQTGQATSAGDVYGLGVTLLTLLTGQSPLVLQPSPGIWNWRAYSSVSNPLAALLDKTVAFHPQLRYATAMQVFQAFQALPDAVHSSDAPTSDPPASLPDAAIAAPVSSQIGSPTGSQTVSQTGSQTVPFSPTIPVAAPVTVNSAADSADSAASNTRTNAFPWPWVVLGIGSLLLLSLISFAAARFLSPSQEPISETPTELPTDSASDPSPLPDAEIPQEETAEPGDSPTPDAESPFAQEDFPKATCGDAMPTDVEAFPVEFHPVYVPNQARNLRRIRSQFCQDALSVTRKDTAEKAIQVASFNSLERAEQFQQFLDDEFGEAEVGQATVYDRPISESEPPNQSDDQDREDNESPPKISTDRVSFAPGETGTRLRGEVFENQLQRYLINCGRGQQFSLRIENGNVQAVVISPDGATLGSIGEEGAEWQGTLPSTGDYTLEVAPLEQDANYRIAIEVL